MRIDIRPAEISDIEDMSRVVDSCWRENFKDIFTLEQIERYTGEPRRSSFRKLLSDGKFIYILLIDGIISAVCAGESCEEKLFRDCVKVILLYVAPEKQRNGNGKKLLMYSLREFRKKGFKCAVLETAELNENARKFYEKFGFSEQKSAAREFEGIKYVTYKIDF